MSLFNCNLFNRLACDTYLSYLLVLFVVFIKTAIFCILFQVQVPESLLKRTWFKKFFRKLFEKKIFSLFSIRLED